MITICIIVLNADVQEIYENRLKSISFLGICFFISFPDMPTFQLKKKYWSLKKGSVQKKWERSERKRKLQMDEVGKG